MNVEEYIASGILEAYVMQELSDEESREVERMAEQHPEVRSELDKIGQTIESIAMKTAVAPAAHVRENLLDQIADNEAAPPKVIPISRVPGKNSGFFKYLTAASISLAVISSILAYNYHEKWKETQLELNELIAQNERIAQDNYQVGQQIKKLKKDLKITNDPSYRNVILAGTDNAPQSSARVYWRSGTQEVYLSIFNMEALPQDRQYQLWAIIDGQPVDAGVFDADIAELIQMKNIGAGVAAFAVTIEPRGGSTSPALETMQVIGNV